MVFAKSASRRAVSGFLDDRAITVSWGRELSGAAPARLCRRKRRKIELASEVSSSESTRVAVGRRLPLSSVFWTQSRVGMPVKPAMKTVEGSLARGRWRV